MISVQPVTVNGERLWRRLMEMAEIGATPAGGCNRQALTDEDKAGRDLFVKWCRSAACNVTVDEIGNIFARRGGADNDLPPIVVGSHLDTQPTGGKFDGVYGVLAGLEIIETMNEGDVSTLHPLEAVVWTNEEGVRFSPGMTGSGVFVGEFPIAEAYAIADRDGITLGAELDRIGYKGSVRCEAKTIKAAFEAHIEQGPILEAAGKQVGIVTGVQGLCWYDIVLDGEPAHAGPTPMESRRDPFMALHRILNRLYALTDECGPWARITFGDIRAEPGSRNTVPGRLILTVDLRHPDSGMLEIMDNRLRRIVEEECVGRGLKHGVHDEWSSPAVNFAPACIDSVRSAAMALGYSAMEMVSGAGHDSGHIARLAPTAMIFVPCKNGISHNEREYASQNDLEAGCNVLLGAVLDQAGVA